MNTRSGRTFSVAAATVAVGTFLAACGTDAGGGVASVGGDASVDAAGGSAGGGGSAGAGGSAGTSVAGAAGFPGTCKSGEKFCGGACVSVQSPAYGCAASDSCDPCNVINATATCQEGTCSVGTCQAPFKDCDGSAVNGCETNVNTDAKNCGACNKPCAAGLVCNDGGCASSCGAKTNCGGSCVDTNSDIANCGGCSKPCASGAAGKAVCAGGKCDEVCVSGATKCGGTCVYTSSDIANCGGCSKSCASGAAGKAVCVGGKCDEVCVSGATKCGGTCVYLQTDAHNCGTCGHDCLGGACSAGVCQPFDLVPSTALNSLQTNIKGLALNGDYLYWLSKDDAAIYRINTKTGIKSAKLMTICSNARGLSYFGGNLYWPCRSDNKVQKAVATDCLGGNACVHDISISDDTSSMNILNIVTYFGDIFLADASTRTVYRMPVTGGALTKRVTDEDGFMSLAVAGGLLYVTGATTDVRRMVPIGGSVTTVVKVADIGSHQNIFVHGNDLYFVHFGDGLDANTRDEIYRYNMATKKLTKLATQRARTTYIVADDKAVYWSRAKNGYAGFVPGIAKLAL